MMQAVLLAGATAACLFPARGYGAETVTVELELLLAVDVSSSVSSEEYALQVQGLAKALTDPTVLSAIQGTGRLGIAVSVAQWANAANQVIAIDWMNISGSDSVFRLARQIQHMRRYFVGGDTRIGDAIRFAASELTSNSIESRRMVIDIAGDGGIENMGIAAAARDDATDQGITINGLAIENEISELAGFFRENVIGGEDAFVIRTTSYAHFAVAMRRKLFREITNSPLAMLQDR